MITAGSTITFNTEKFEMLANVAANVDERYRLTTILGKSANESLTRGCLA